MDHDVFLSYASEDRGTARRIAESLEQRGWRVWWDRKVPPGVLYDEVIEEALRHAPCVVVLWSASAVASRWVRAEASDAAQRNILVPVLLSEVTVPLEFRLFQGIVLDGGDASDVAAIGDLDAAIGRIVGRAAAPAAIAASQAPPSRGFSRALAALVAILALLLLAGGGWWWDAFHREHIEYFANVIRRHGFPEGVGRLTSASTAARSVSLAIVRRGRRNPPHELRIVNSDGRTPPLGHYYAVPSMLDLNALFALGGDAGPVPFDDFQVTRVSFSRDAAGRILEQAGETQAGRPVYTLHFATPDLGEYKRKGFSGAVRESGIAYVRVSRATDPVHAGLEEKVVFLDAKRQPQGDEDGGFGFRQVLNANGLPVQRIYLAADGTDSANALGVAKEVREFDDLGNVIHARTLDAKGAPVASRMGFASMRAAFDAVGNMVRATFYDATGQPTVVTALGAAGFTTRYDPRGHLLSQTFVGPDDKPVTGRGGFATTQLTWLTSTRAAYRFFGPTGRPVIPSGSAFEAIAEWNDRGLVIENAFHDEHGRPTRLDDGCSIFRMDYDEVGNVSELRCLDEQGTPTNGSSGYSTLTATYDDAGHRTMMTMHDAQGRLGVLNEAFASIRSAYTAAGNLERDAYLGADGTPVNMRNALASATHEYDARGNQVKTMYWDASGQPASHVEGYSSVRRTFDARGLEVERRFLDPRDAPATSIFGWSRVRLEYDAQGALIGQHYFDRDGQPARVVDGYTSIRLTRNTRGLRIETKYLDEHGRPLIAARYGAAIQRFIFDAGGRTIEQSSYDAQGRLVINAYGYSTLRYHYDEHGRETGRSLLDQAGRVLPHVVAIERVAKASFAADLGFSPGDILIAYDGESVITSDQFTNVLERFRGDRRREVRVRRGDRIIPITVPPGHVSGLELVERAAPLPPPLLHGAGPGDRSPLKEGVVRGMSQPFL